MFLENYKQKQFSFHPDESTDVSGKTQLIPFMRFTEGPQIIEQFYISR
jgi:hypothetical protein